MTETIKQASTPAAALDPPMVVFVPPCQVLLGTAVPPARDMLLLIPFPFIVWGADELRKWVIRTRSSRRAPAAPPAPAA